MAYPVESDAEESAGTGASIELADGRTLDNLSLEAIVQGLREGWLSPDDMIRVGDITENQWRSLRTAARSMFAINVLIKPRQAYQRLFSRVGAILLGVLTLVAWLVFIAVTELDLPVSRALPWGLATSLLFVWFCWPMLSASPLRSERMFGFLVGLFGLASVTGIPLVMMLEKLSGKPPGSGFDLDFVFGLLVPLLLGGAVGAGVGHLVGSVVGRRKGPGVELPAVRQEVPPAYESSILDEGRERRLYLVDKIGDIERLSKASSVLFLGAATDETDVVTAERFRSEALEAIREKARAAGVTLCLAEHRRLKGSDLDSEFIGFYLFRDGELQEESRYGKRDESQQWVMAASELLGL